MNAEYPRSLVPVLQGWVCPGYLVAGAAAEHVTALEAAWAGHALVPPASFTIVAVGVTRGCSFAPFKQVSSEQEHTAQSMCSCDGDGEINLLHPGDVKLNYLNRGK